MKKIFIGLLVGAILAECAFANNEPVFSMVDSKPYVMKMYGVRSAGAVSDTKIQVVIGCSQTGAAFSKKSYRIISKDDPNYDYKKFVQPVDVKKIEDLSIQKENIFIYF